MADDDKGYNKLQEKRILEKEEEGERDKRE